MPLHPAENRGYRELYLTGRQTVKRLGRLAVAFDGSPARELLDKAADSISRLLEELGPLTARHDLHGGVAAQGSGANLGTVRGAVFDRFLERNQALRFAVEDLEHVTTLLGYLARVGEARGDHDAVRVLRLLGAAAAPPGERRPQGRDRARRRSGRRRSSRSTTLPPAGRPIASPGPSARSASGPTGRWRGEGEVAGSR